MITRITAIALTAILFLVQTATAQITSAPRFVQIRSINLTTSVLELFNTGTSSQSLAGWRFCTHDEDQVRRYSATAGLNSFTLRFVTAIIGGSVVHTINAELNMVRNVGTVAEG